MGFKVIAKHAVTIMRELDILQIETNYVLNSVNIMPIIATRSTRQIADTTKQTEFAFLNTLKIIANLIKKKYQNIRWNGIQRIKKRFQKKDR